MNSDLAAAPFSWGYAMGAICFGAGFVLLAVVTVAVGDRINRHVQRALNSGDAEVRRFVAEIEAYEREQAAKSRRVR
jgi:hypothetical protein